ncbi:MAG: murein L,D-transpeptidase family protein [Spirochaetota bacterium]
MNSKRFPPSKRIAFAAAVLAVCSASCLPESAHNSRVRLCEKRAGELAGKVEPVLVAAFGKAGVEYPPRTALLLAFKKEKLLELRAPRGGKYVPIKSYRVLGASGGPGPKLREGDRQVPEGIYPVTGLNPDSNYHLALAIGYPNDFDLAMAARDGRTDPGGDIHIHGGDYSAGCLAVGDEAIEELFLLAVRTGPENLRVIIAPHASPTPFRRPGGAPPWTDELYRTIRAELDRIDGSGVRR